MELKQQIILPYIITIVCTVVHYPQVTDNKYVNTIYYYHYSIIPYISYEAPVQLIIPTTDPYHISRDEVCTVITN